LVYGSITNIVVASPPRLLYRRFSSHLGIADAGVVIIVVASAPVVVAAAGAALQVLVVPSSTNPQYQYYVIAACQIGAIGSLRALFPPQLSPSVPNSTPSHVAEDRWRGNKSSK
jgi:hypothetical protein